MRRSHLQSHMPHWPRGHVTNQKRYISTFTRPTDPKLCRVVAQDEEISSTKSHDTSTTWSRDKSKNVISPLSQGLWILNLASSWLKTREPPPTKSRDTSITWLGDKSKTFYLHIHKAHGPQNLVGCWLRMRGPHLKSHVTLQLCGQMENQKRHIFSTTGPSRYKKKTCARQK